MSRARSYCFTINHYTVEDTCRILDADTKYLIFGYEEGDKGTPHMQGYVQFPYAKTFNSVKKLLPRAHLEVAKGTPDANIKYCSKDGEFYEFGKRPTNGGEHGYKSTELTEKVIKAFEDPVNNLQIIRQYGRTYRIAKDLELKVKKVDTEFYVIDPIHDLLTEVLDYFGDIDLVVVQDLQELAFYDDPQDIVFVPPSHMTDMVRWNLFARGMPITYKYGYEYRCVKPNRFIICTPGKRKFFPLYRNI